MPHTNRFFSIICNCSPSKRKWGGEREFFFSLRTEFFVSVFQAKISTEVYIFSETASFTPFIVKLSQWVKLSPNDIIAKMFLPHQSLMTMISYVNMCPTQKMDGPEILRATFVYFTSAGFCPVSRRCKAPDYSPDELPSLLHCLFQFFNIKEQSQFGFTCIVL